MSIRSNYIPHKTCKLDYYKELVYMNKEVISYLKKISKLAKNCSNNPTDRNKYVVTKSEHCL